MRKLIAVLSLFAIVALTSVSSGSNGGTTIKTDYGGIIEMPLHAGSFMFVADEATVPTGICLKETGTFERMYDAPETLFSKGVPILVFSPIFGPIDHTGDNQHLAHDNPVSNDSYLRSGHNSIKGARLKIVLPALC